MVKRFEQPTPAEAMANALAGNKGRQSISKPVKPGDRPAVAYVRLSRFLTEAERDALAASIKALMPDVILDIELLTEAEVPDLGPGWDFQFQVATHIKPRPARD